VKLTVCFFFSTPKNIRKQDLYIPHTVKPDADNLLKAVMDAMTAASVWTDDAIVYSSCSEKWYTSGKNGAKIKVEVR
jgi:Holliday junction resolvase RusA-like endonuclease